MEKPTPWYNDIKKVEEGLLLKGLDYLNRLIEARKKQFTKGNGECVGDNLLIAGQIIISWKGEIKILSGLTPQKRFPLLDLVVEEDKYDNFIEWYYEIKYREVFFLPNSTVLCPFCGLGWNIHNCSDFKSDERERSYPVTKKQLGMQLGKAIKEIAKPSRKKLIIPHFRHRVFNKKHIHDEKPFKPGDQYKIKPGDCLRFHEITLFHKKCFNLFSTRRRTKFLASAFERARIKIEPIELLRHRNTNLGLGLRWQVSTEFGILEVVEYSEGNFRIKGFSQKISNEEDISSSRNSLVKDLKDLKRRYLR